jgi:hypothetical protein
MNAPVFAEGVELARLTTIGTGGPARAYAEPRSTEELEAVLVAAQVADQLAGFHVDQVGRPLVGLARLHDGDVLVVG